LRNRNDAKVIRIRHGSAKASTVRAGRVVREVCALLGFYAA